MEEYLGVPLYMPVYISLGAFMWYKSFAFGGSERGGFLLVWTKEATLKSIKMTRASVIKICSARKKNKLDYI
ncbi:MAG TPA: hypothetical protein PKD85_09935 [Saprospiraceae bacterium]|nr:hypothetical protein [Saprospiraceae bacterium]